MMLYTPIEITVGELLNRVRRCSTLFSRQEAPWSAKLVERRARSGWGQNHLGNSDQLTNLQWHTPLERKATPNQRPNNTPMAIEG